MTYPERVITILDKRSEQVINVPNFLNDKHQIAIEINISSGSVDAESTLTIYGKPYGVTEYISLGVVDLTSYPNINLFEGIYTNIKLIPNSTFINDTDVPTYNAYYFGWK